ncbi:MAG: ATP-dependent helicase [Candidatus Aminicenantes bacterium]|nr:ATP-dependent helicase [Candidatus Aminicenantes bacterium]
MKKYTLKRHNDEQKRHFVIDYKAELNPQQLEAVINIDGPHLVIAGAGSGKTRTLIFRVAYLVENNIPPQAILLLTFTRKASQEMMRRAATILDERCKNVSGGTFHSFANYILRKYALQLKIYPNYSIVDRGDAEDIINLIRSDMGLNKKERRFPRKSTITDIISKAVNKRIPIDEVVFDDYPHYKRDIDEILAIAEKYRSFKKEKMVMDYDDLLVNLKILLETDEESRKKICSSYRYIMVDEYQDTNKLQAEIAALLASEHHNILVVGDDAQSIYSFRGANFRNIMDFPKLFPEARITTLEQNYRSTRPILDLTNAIIEQAKEKYSKELFSQIEGEEKPVYIDAVDEHEQAAFIAQRVLELREEEIPLSRIAVLFRASWHANELEVELKSRNIPYVKYGGLKFAEAAHIKDVLSYMRVLHNILDEIAWLRVLLLIEGIGAATAAKIVEKVFRSGGDLAALLAADFDKKKFSSELRKLHAVLARLVGSSLTPAEKLQVVLEYYSPLFESKYDDYRRRLEDLESLLRISERYSSLEQMLTEMALEPPNTTQTGVEPADREEEKLVLSTIHSAKGLEWHTVFIIHLVDGYFPSDRSVEDETDLEEERRLFYVAATRAEKNLYLITPELETRSWNSYAPSGIVFSQPSRFIEEIPGFEQLTETWTLEPEDYDPF